MGHQGYVLLCTETTLSNPPVVQPKSSYDVHLLRSLWLTPTYETVIWVCKNYNNYFPFRSGGWEWHRCTFESRCSQASAANFDQFKYFTPWPDRSDKFLPNFWLKDVNQSFEFKKKFNGFINGRINWRFTNGLWYFDFFNQFGVVLCFEWTQYSWRLKYEFGSVF